ncbi:MAG: DUF1254 domain-containing protein [Okeania sp. SIO2D1]|nr:DUF1254 domain-containing protein [Okeania sp. SIO2D1]
MRVNPFYEVLSMFFNGLLNRILKGVVAFAIAIAFLLSAVTPPVLAAESGFDWEEEYAYTLGIQAFIYAYPWAYMPVAYWTRLKDTNGERGEEGKVNKFFHYKKLRDDTHTAGGGPNNDTIYSHAVIYLGDEPLILKVPKMKRYYSMELTDYRGDNFAYVGKRATGLEAGNYALIGPNWEGELPSNVKRIEGSSSTPWAYITGRTLVTERERELGILKRIYNIQKGYELIPLSQWLDPTVTPSVPDLWEPYLYDSSTDPLAYWKNINHAMGENPPDPYDNSLLALFAEIGIGPNLDVELQSDSIKRGLERASTDGLRIIDDAFATGYAQKLVNGWNYPPPEIGRPSASREWLVRAIQARAGFVAHDPIEGIYMNISLDGDGNRLSGENLYQLRFEEGEQPEVNEFWSITMYNSQYNLVSNEIDRFSVGDRSKMNTAEDGSLTISIQHDRPSECPSKDEDPSGDECPNWLPAPEGNFLMFMRLYLPGYPALSQWWEPPALTNLGPASEPNGDALSAQAVEDVAQEDFWDTIIQQVEKRYSTK